MALNSLFTGLSGIQVHQIRTNVVADNLANINTTGFKSRRANFQDQLAQTLKEATGPEGTISGTNPTQAGTGVRLKSIETNFSQGNLLTTGRQTDLAIEGTGFFILSDGVDRVYTRDGAFTFDAHGRLINPNNGFVVQGNVADSAGGFGATTGLQNVQVDLNQEIPGVATSQVNLSGNVDPGPVSVLTEGTEYAIASTLTTAAFPTALTEEQKVEVMINTPEKLLSGLITVPDASYSSASAYVDALNASIAGNERLAGNVIAQVDPANSANVQLRTTFGGPGVQLALANVGTGTGVQSLGFTAPGATSDDFPNRTVSLGTESETATLLTTELNDLAQVGSFLSAGDILRFSGTRADGSTYNDTFSFDPDGNDTQNTIGDLLTVVSATFGDDVSASLSPTGKITFLDSNGNAVTGWTLNVALDDAETGNQSGLIGLTGLRHHKISTAIYDSQGRNHVMSVSLAETPVSNKWTWSIKVDNQTPSKGASGTAIFDEDGSIREFVPTEGEGTLLEFTPNGEVLPLKVSFTGLTKPDKGIQGLTQFAAPATADVVEQNGRSSGRLDTIFFRPNGVIVGRFTNGVTLNMARVNLGNFDNDGGLRRLGGNLYGETENTGNPLIEVATETIESQIVSEALENSNVDLATELTDLIVSQRGFQANARVVTTTDQILAETVNLKQ